MGIKFLIYLPQAECLQHQRATPLSDFYPILWWQVEKAKPPSLLLLVVLLHSVLNDPFSYHLENLLLSVSILSNSLPLNDRTSLGGKGII